jgi:hypothetical protein
LHIWFYLSVTDGHTDCAHLAGVPFGTLRSEIGEDTRLNDEIPLRNDYSRNLLAARRTGAL